MIMLLALQAAATALPTPPTAIERRCVAVIATVAYEQARGRWKTLPAIGGSGGEYAAIIGARLIDEAGMTEAAAGQVFRDEAAAFKTRPFDKAEVEGCLTIMEATLAAQPLPEPKR
jgi:predicted secreted protein